MTFTKEQAKGMSILEVATALDMELKRQSHQEYYWTAHDSLKINTRKNTFYWNSRGIGGDTINLVETIKNVSFKEAMHFLETGAFPEVSLDVEPRGPFHYSLAPYEQDFTEARAYLTQQRGLSDETVDFFSQQGVLAQAMKKAQDGYLEPVLVFKYHDRQGELLGASLQGLKANQERYEGRGYLKQIMYNSDGLAGMSVDIGQPERLIFTEAPIDLMSYYELHKERLANVRLVAMEGLKEQTISRYFMELYAELQGETDYVPDLSKVGTALATAAQTTTFFDQPENANLITLAIDNDEAGNRFLTNLDEKGIKASPDLPPAGKGGQKMDWNEYLKQTKGLVVLEKNEYLGKANTKREEEPDMSDESKQKSLEQAQGIETDRSKISSGSLQLEAEGSPIPVAESATFEQAVTSHPTVSYPLLKFSTENAPVSSIRQGYHLATETDLRNLNYFARGLQETATWYRDTLANSTVTYFLKGKGNEPVELRVDFSKDKFAHLTGIRPVGSGLTAERVLDDFVEGRGHYGNITVNNGFLDKAQVLPMLQEITMSKSFVFTNLDEVAKMRAFKASHAIQSQNKALVIALRTVDDVTFPASLLKSPKSLTNDLIHKAMENEILGVVRERDGKVDVLSLNDDYIKDQGAELLSLVRDRDRLLEDELTKQEQTTAERQLDSDGDGISNEDELRLGTDPHNANSRPGKQEEEHQPLVLTKEAIASLIADKDTTGLRDHLREGMRQYMSSDQYKTFLVAMSKFHNYSHQNIMLMLMQNPEITHVASYNKWKKEFGRQVKKGEKGLKIRVPVTFKVKDENGQPKIDENGQEMTVTRFKFDTVFDISQTDGKPLPKAVYNLENDVLDYQNLYRAARQVSEANGIPISFEAIVGSSANGFYNPSEQRIVLADKKMSEAQIMKTLFHEMAHSDLHQQGTVNRRDPDYAKQELQAESVAYVVASHYGIDTSDYSFAYLSSWAKDPDGLVQFEDQLKVVQAEAKSLINRIDNALALIKNKDISQDKFQSKLHQAQKQQDTLSQSRVSQEQAEKKSQDMVRSMS